MDLHPVAVLASQEGLCSMDLASMQFHKFEHASIGEE